MKHLSTHRKKTTVIPLVVARTRKGPNQACVISGRSCMFGVVGFTRRSADLQECASSVEEWS